MLDIARVPLVIVERGTRERSPRSVAMMIDLDAEADAIAAESPEIPRYP